MIFSSTYFLRMFGACRSNDSILGNMTASTEEDCANECVKLQRCQFVSFNNDSQPNCNIGGQFCGNSTDRIHRGNHKWLLLKRISDAPFGNVQIQLLFR